MKARRRHPAESVLPAVAAVVIDAPKADPVSKSNKLSGTVRSLIASSLGLPGMQELLAQQATDEGISYQLTHYDEQPLPADKLAAGSPERYTINSQQLRWVKNLDDSYSLTVEGLYEGMSGSSPWYVIPDPVAGPLQVMSGATIRDHRSQLDVRLSRRDGGITHAGALGYSSEDDYQAMYGSYAGEKENDDGLTTLAWGASYSHDEIRPTDAQLYDRVPRATKEIYSASAGISRVLNPNSVFQSGLSLTLRSGFLSDPYKLVWVDNFILNDNRPDQRFSWSWTTRFRQYLETSKTALHIDGRYYGDDWGIRSVTLDTAWHRPVGENWELAPAIRYYSQRAPAFYGPVFDTVPGDGLWSSDYRLATYGAISYSLNAIMRREEWSFSMFAEFYDSQENLALFGTPQDTPALIDFWRFTVRLTVNL